MNAIRIRAKNIALMWVIVLIVVSMYTGSVAMLPKAVAQTAQNDTMQSRYQRAGISSQGIAYDGMYRYIFETTAIRKLNDSYVLIDSNTKAAKNVGVNHLGDGCYYNGRLYIACCNFSSCSQWDSGRIGIWGIASGLPFITFIDISDQAFDPSGIAIDAATGYAYMSSYCSNVVHKYDINNGWAHVGTIIPTPAFTSTQGIAYDNNHLYVSQPALGVVRTDMNGTNPQTILPINSISGLELEGLYVDAHIIMVVNKPYIYTYLNQWDNLP
jgi:hypothetical protein